VGGGAAGAIIIQDGAGDVPLSVANMPETLLFMQYFPVVTGLLQIAEVSLHRCTPTRFQSSAGAVPDHDSKCLYHCILIIA
jgi:hypothetical protein